MSIINLNKGDNLSATLQNGRIGAPVDARQSVLYYKDIFDSAKYKYPYAYCQVIVRENDPEDTEHPKGIYVITEVDRLGDVVSSGVIPLSLLIDGKLEDITIATTKDQYSVELGRINSEDYTFRIEAGSGIKVDKWAINPEANAAQISADTDVLATKTDLTAKADKSNTFTKAETNTLLDTKANATDVNAIEAKIPSLATAQNQLADKDFVNSSIATATADFKGTVNSVADLDNLTANNNDYAFVVTTDQAGNIVYKRYKYNGTIWLFEYDLNNSSFTAAQWATINSGVTSQILEDIAYIGYDDGQAVIPEFDPQTDTLHKKAQVLTASEKAQVKSNLGLDSELNELKQAVSTLNKDDVVVVDDHTTVTNPSADKIYREVGTASYSDYMYYNNAWKKLAEYSLPGIDDEPTAGSDNLVKSGGVAKNLQLLKNGVYLIPNAYLGASSIVPISFINDEHKLSCLLYEFESTEAETINCSLYNASPISYSHFLDEDMQIISGSSFNGSSSTPLKTSISKPSGAKYLFATNYMVENPNPFVDETIIGYLQLLNEFKNNNGDLEKVLFTNPLYQNVTINSYYKSNSTVPISIVSDEKLGTIVFEFENTNADFIFIGCINASSVAYCHFLDSNLSIISSIAGISGTYTSFVGNIIKPQGAKYIAVTNYFKRCPSPFVTKTIECLRENYINSSFKFTGENLNGCVSYNENSYYKSTSITPVPFVNDYKLSTIIFEFENTKSEMVFIDAINASNISYCHFLDENYQILSSVVGIAGSIDVPVGWKQKPNGAKYIAVTNYMVVKPLPQVSGTIGIANKVNTLWNKDYPYVFDVDFIKGKIDAYIIEGNYTLTVNGATISNGYSNKLGVKRWVSPTECAIFADIVLTDVDSKICLSTIETIESTGKTHASVVTFDFENSKIIVYPKSSGVDIPATALTEQTVTNISGNDYRIEFGRKNRNLYAALTNNRTCVRQEVVIDEDDYDVVTQAYPAGWIREFPYISVLDGGCYIQDIKGIIPKADIVFLGDSITEGLRCAYDDCWCKIVMDELKNGINFGISGGKVSECQEIVDTILPYIRPKYVVVTIGTNGGNTLKNLTALRDSIVKLGAIPIFNHIAMYNSNTASINSTIDKLNCDGAKFDVATAINNNPSDGKNTSMYNTDGVHPNTLGHAAMATRFLLDLSYLKYKL